MARSSSAVWMVALVVAPAFFAVQTSGTQSDIITVDGVDILSPTRTEEYRQAQTLYWRTVLSLPAENNPLDPAVDAPDAGCPQAIKWGNKGQDIYLITSVVLTGTTPKSRTCSIPKNKPVIISLYSDLEWYSPPADSSLFFGNPAVFPPTVRLTPDSLCSLAQANADLPDPSCVKATINDVPVPITRDFFHVSPFVCDLDISPGFFQTLEGFNFLGGLPEGPTRKLLSRGIKNTDQCDAGFYLILPQGFTKPGTYVITSGFLEGCAAYSNPWFQKGFIGQDNIDNSDTCKGKGKRNGHDGGCDYNQKGTCWPDSIGCRAGLGEVATPDRPAVGITYTIHVE